jgi:tetratricopeptide (TPR) repeat protein
MQPTPKILFAGVIFLLVVPFSFAQRQGGNSGGGQRTTNPAPSPSTTPSQPRPTIRGNETERGLVLVTGRVVTEEGTPPPQSVSIERVCGGAERREGYTDSQGYFSLQLGSSTNGIMQDASVGGSSMDASGMQPGMPSAGTMMPDPGLSQNDLMSCELSASLSGYQSTRVPLFSARVRSANDVGVIVIYKLDRSQATMVSASSMRAPKDAKKAYEKGRKLLQKNKNEEAAKELQKALDIDPGYADAWFAMGAMHQGSNQVEDARRCYQKALELDSHFILPYIQLAYLALQENDWKSVLSLTDRALALNPFSYPAIHFFNAVANFNLHNYDAAERSSKKADLLDSKESFPRNHLLLSQLLSQKGDYQGAAQELRTYVQVQPKADDLPQVKQELSRLETLMKNSPQQQQPQAQQEQQKH